MANEKIVNRENLKEFRKAFQTNLENGQIVPSKALTAKQLENVNEEVGSIQEEPFIFQATATDNGADSVETAPIAKHLKKQGNSVVVNQLVQNGNFSSTTGWSASGTGTLSASNNVITLTISNNNSLGQLYRNVSIITGHKYLVSGDFKPSIASSWILRLAENYAGGVYCAANTWTTISRIITATQTGSKEFNFFHNTADLMSGDTLQARKAMCIDLTQWFGSNDLIPQDLLDHPENASRYGMLGLAYNTGTLTDCNGRYLKCIGRQQWDEEVVAGGLNANGSINTSGADSSRITTSFIRVIPNTTYYQKCPALAGAGRVAYYDANKNPVLVDVSSGIPANWTFTTPSNACYMRITFGSGYGTTYKHDITISIYYADGTGYSDYYQYEENTYDTGTETLRSAGSVRDVKLPDGTINRLVGFVDLETLSWNKSGSTTGGFYASFDGEYPLGSGVIMQAICGLYLFDGMGSSGTGYYGSNGTFRFASVSQASAREIYIVDTSKSSLTAEQFATAMNGVILNYELATPTTEQGTPFAENVIVDNYGTMGWLDTSENYVNIPQGSEFFYPADYVEFIDSLYTRSKDGGDSADVSNIVVKSEINDFVKQIDLSDQITDVAGLTYNIKKIYKQGNLVSITIRADNMTGSDIAAGTTLFTLTSGLYASSLLRVSANISSTNTSAKISNAGIVNLESNFPSTQTLFIIATYAVA